ncbi:2-C-methyl-D-erythritol 4-phosphate cytidylyltransferase [Rodentibacter caecimuris]|uniref:2-C-methyl-D-erythritol 4-phosphate cytidylyltransferase n=2 Tax=Rodentibacter caecimuris TaxID=1796644 RepID=A0ABX3L1F0_9PAST|nr:2-C-methyl-D-erythritol 4-phosphate cytidylyltransferase [Rodentibacter heylii]
MQAHKPKQYLKILNKTILEHSLTLFLRRDDIHRVIVALNPNDPYFSTTELLKHPKIQLVDGGENRADSVLNGLNIITDEQAWVLVHDAARPCLNETDLNKLLSVEDSNGAILAIPATDTIKRASDNENKITATEDRSKLWLAQTPQFFPVDLLRKALTQAIKHNLTVTDEASAMELCGFKPLLINGRSDNIKITRPEDLALAEFYLTRKQHD